MRPSTLAPSRLARADASSQAAEELDARGFARLVCSEPMTGFVDVGSGLGKLVLVAAALSGAPCWGVELSPLRAAEAKRGLQQMRFPKRQQVRRDGIW